MRDNMCRDRLSFGNVGSLSSCNLILGYYVTPIISDGSLLPKETAQFMSEKGFNVIKSNPIIPQCVSVFLCVCVSVCPPSLCP